MNIKFEQHKSERLYPIGYQFTWKQGKRDPKQATVIDYAITYNSLGAVTKFRYILEYPFLTQTMKTSVPQTTIDISTNNGWKEL